MSGGSGDPLPRILGWPAHMAFFADVTWYLGVRWNLVRSLDHPVEQLFGLRLQFERMTGMTGE